MNKFIQGGFFKRQKNQIMFGVGVLSALCAYLVGDSDLFAMLESVIAIGGVYLLHKSSKNKGK